MTWLRILLVLALATFRALAQTNTADVRVLTLQDCIQSALQKNLDLQIARYGPPLALESLDAAYAGYDPNLTLSGAHNYYTSAGGYNAQIGTLTAPTVGNANSFNSTVGGLLPWGLNYTLLGNISDNYGSAAGQPFEQTSGQVGFSLTQPLLKNFWIDITRLNIRVAKNRLKYSELTLKYQVMQTITTVENAYYDLIYSRENVTVQEKAVELAMQLVRENKKRVEVGALAPLDEQQAEAQAASSQAALIAARSTLAVQEHTVKQLITDEYSAWMHFRVEPAETLSSPRMFFDLQDSWIKGLTTRPDLLQAKLDIEKQGVTIKYTYNQLFPELDVIGTYGHNASGFPDYTSALGQYRDGSLPYYSYGGQLTFPIGNHSARSAYRSSKIVMQQLVLTLKKVEEGIMVAIDNDIKLAESNFEQVAAARTARDYAAAALDAEQKKLESGKSTTYTVLQMQRDLTTARGTEIQALDNYNKSLSQLSLDEGTTLKRLNILFEAN
jgi:outer membrane protein TolC